MNTWLPLLVLSLLFVATPLPAQPVNVSGVIINELYYDVTSNNGGNWNGGPSSATDDQFIELYNDSNNDVNMQGWVISAKTTFNFLFTDSLVLGAHRSLVLAKTIGTHVPPVGHLAVAYASVGTLMGTWGFSASGDCIFLVDPGPDHGVGGLDPDDIWMTFSYEGAPDQTTMYNGRSPNGTKNGHESDGKNVVGQSLNRNPDITGTAWEGHLSLNPSKACSPNRKVDGTSPLPVTFLRLQADWRAERGDVLVRWSCEEFNSAGYSIERRLAGESEWSTRGYLPASCAGRCVGEYAFADSGPDRPTRCEYRIREIDASGDASVSPAVSVDAGSPAEFSLSVYPNPPVAGSPVTVKIDGIDPGSGSPVRIGLYDQLGRLVHSLYTGVPDARTITVRFDAAFFSSGTYYCLYRSGTRAVVRPLPIVH